MRGVFRVIKLASIALLLLLAGCSTIHAPPGYECDPYGACWPMPLAEPVRLYEVVYEPLEQIRSGHAVLKGANSSAFGYIELGTNPALIHIADELPHKALVCGWSKDIILRHEIGHLNGVTKHNMVTKRNC